MKYFHCRARRDFLAAKVYILLNLAAGGGGIDSKLAVPFSYFCGSTINDQS